MIHDSGSLDRHHRRVFPSAAGWMHRFARDVITTNPVSRSPLSPVQIYLLEQALECVDWPALARDRRLRHLDWSRASLVYPRSDCGVARSPGPAPRPAPGRLAMEDRDEPVKASQRCKGLPGMSENARGLSRPVPGDIRWMVWSRGVGHCAGRSARRSPESTTTVRGRHSSSSLPALTFLTFGPPEVGQAGRLSRPNSTASVPRTVESGSSAWSVTGPGGGTWRSVNSGLNPGHRWTS